MTIKRRYERTPRLPLVGTIHLGIIKTNPKGVQYPAATDYFVVTERDNTPADAVKAFREVYGEQPKEIDVIFPTADRTQFADRNYEAWTKGYKRVCKGDGEKAMAKWDAGHDGPRPVDEDGVDVLEAGTWVSEAQRAKDEKVDWQMREIPCFGTECPMFKAKKCKPITHLMFYMPRIPLIGVWRISFGSEHGYDNIQDHLHLLETLVGRAHGITVKLRLRPIQVTPPGERTKTVMVLDIAPPSMSLDQLAAGVARLPNDRLLAAPAAVDGEDPWLFTKYGKVPEEGEEADGDEPDDLEGDEIEHAVESEPIEGVARDVTAEQAEAPPIPDDDIPAPAPIEAPEPDADGLAQRRFWVRQKERFKRDEHRMACKYLGMTETGTGAITAYWLDPAEALGLTRAEAFDLADRVIGDVLTVALAEQTAKNPKPLITALERVVPVDRMHEAAREKAETASAGAA